MSRSWADDLRDATRLLSRLEDEIKELRREVREDQMPRLLEAQVRTLQRASWTRDAAWICALLLGLVLWRVW